LSSKPVVFATRNLPGSGLERLAGSVDLDLWNGPEFPSASVLAARAATADGLLCLLSDRITADLFDKCPRLRVVSSCSVGVDHIDVPAATARGIRIGHTPGVLVETTADLAFGLLLAAARRIPEADRYVREGRWSGASGWDPELLLGRDLHGATLGILGLGESGRAVARRAAGFGMRVLAWARSGREQAGVELVPFDDLLAQSDFLSVHIASTPATRGLLDAEALARLPLGAILVNTARGGILDETALTAALAEGRLAGAALDVYAREPLPPDSPLLRAPNLVLTPHIGSASIATRRRMADMAVDNLLAGLSGGPMPHCVNAAEVPGRSADRRFD
jgi:glyoxylate reductase